MLEIELVGRFLLREGLTKFTLATVELKKSAVQRRLHRQKMGSKMSLYAPAKAFLLSMLGGRPPDDDASVLSLPLCIPSPEGKAADEYETFILSSSPVMKAADDDASSLSLRAGSPSAVLNASDEEEPLLSSFLPVTNAADDDASVPLLSVLGGSTVLKAADEDESTLSLFLPVTEAADDDTPVSLLSLRGGSPVGKVLSSPVTKSTAVDEDELVSLSLLCRGKYKLESNEKGGGNGHFNAANDRYL